MLQEDTQPEIEEVPQDEGVSPPQQTQENSEEENKSKKSGPSRLQQAKGLKDMVSTGSKLAKTGLGAAARTGAGTAAGTAGGAAAGAGGGAAAGAAAGSVIPGAGTAAGAAAGAAASKLAPSFLKRLLAKAAKAVAVLVAGIFAAGCGCFLAALFFPLLIIIVIVVGILGGLNSLGGAAGQPPQIGDSLLLVIHKTVDKPSIARGATGADAQVIYTITVDNNSDKEATGITVTESFTSTPEASFASEITGCGPSYTIASLAPKTTDTRTCTVTIPHTDYDPGWVLTNSVRVTGAIDGKTESSQSSAPVVVGTPASGPPAFSPLKGDVRVTGYRFNETTSGGHPHTGVDILGTGLEIYSPFAQPVVVTFAGGTCGNTGYGQYMTLESGEWKVLMAHFACQQFYVGQGETVTSDQVLGVVGLTGLTTGLHLHYEVYKNGVRVDPEDYNALVPHP